MRRGSATVSRGRARAVLGARSAKPRSAHVWVAGVRNPQGEADVIAALRACTVPAANGVLRIGGKQPGDPFTPAIPGFQRPGAGCGCPAVSC